MITKEEYDRRFKNVMYISIAIIVVSMFAPLFTAYEPMQLLFSSSHTALENGKLDASSYDIMNSAPLQLVGEWNTYEGVYLDSDIIEENFLEDPIITYLPKASLYTSQGTRTYQGYVNFTILEENREEIVISIPLATQEISMYVNGKRVYGIYAFDSWAGHSGSMMMYSLEDVYDETREFQEITISVNRDEGATDLVNRVIVIADTHSLKARLVVDYVMQGALCGVMFLIIMNAMMYMGLMPTYSTLTFMNLYDITLMTYMLYNFSTLPKVITSIFNPNEFGDFTIRSNALMFFMAAGALGNELVKSIFDKANVAPWYFRKPTNIAYCLLAVAVYFYPAYFNEGGIILTSIVLIWTYIGVVVTWYMNYKAGVLEIYQHVHLAKILFIGGVLFVDVLTTNLYPRPKVFILVGYGIFLIVHLFMRAYEYKIPYMESKKLNETLEIKVEERTKELSKANEVLRTLSERDALTKAFNRLYFEEEVLQVIDEFNKGNGLIQIVHLCIFDLDNFKSINDTYGHNEGDGQLIDTVKMVTDIVSEDITVSRIGGEEFTLLFMNYENEEVLSVVEEVRSEMEKMANQVEARTTGSFGICRAKMGINRKELFQTADTCLYSAKYSGKNRIIYNFNGKEESYKKD